MPSCSYCALPPYPASDSFSATCSQPLDASQPWTQSWAALQGALLANYSQNFIEQLRAASPYRAPSPYKPSSSYSFSTRGPKPSRRRLTWTSPFSQGSRALALLMYLKRTVQKAWPWGAAADYRRRTTMVSCFPAKEAPSLGTRLLAVHLPSTHSQGLPDTAMLGCWAECCLAET